MLWWIHTLTLLAFLPLIPHTKHLHLVLSPLTIFLERSGFSHIPPLAGDEDFGLVAGKDITQITALQAYSCVECGRCTEHCPANNTGKELNPKLIALGLRSYLNEYGNANETPILSATVSQKAIFQCTTCGACEYQCPVGIQHLPMIIGLRRGAVNTGTWEDEYGTKLFLNLERNGNAMGFSQSERDKFIAKQEFPIFDGSQEYCLWLGCMGAYDPRGREIISSFATVMKHLGTSFGVLKKERCTGDPVRRLGNDLVFGQLAETNLSTLEASGREEDRLDLPALRPHYQEDWREFGAEIEIEHHSEFLARHADKLPAKQTGERVVFHDPCYLGPVSRDLRRAATGDRAIGDGDRSASCARAQFLLRSGRRAGFSGRRNRPARERDQGQRTGRYGSRHHRRRLPVLQQHVPRRAGRDERESAALTRYRADCGRAD